MKLISLIRRSLNESDRSEHHALWDQVVEAISDEGHELMVLLDFLACTYNGGLAGTILERAHRFTLTDVMNSLLHLRETSGANEASYLRMSLRAISSVATQSLSDYKNTNSDEDQELENVMEVLNSDPDVNEIEDWIYDDENIDPILRGMLEYVQQQSQPAGT